MESHIQHNIVPIYSENDPENFKEFYIIGIKIVKDLMIDKKNPLLNLPDDILAEIISTLDLKSALALTSVSNQLRSRRLIQKDITLSISEKENLLSTLGKAPPQVYNCFSLLINTYPNFFGIIRKKIVI